MDLENLSYEQLKQIEETGMIPADVQEAQPAQAAQTAPAPAQPQYQAPQPQYAAQTAPSAQTAPVQPEPAFQNPVDPVTPQTRQYTKDEIDSAWWSNFGKTFANSLWGEGRKEAMEDYRAQTRTGGATDKFLGYLSDLGNSFWSGLVGGGAKIAKGVGNLAGSDSLVRGAESFERKVGEYLPTDMTDTAAVDENGNPRERTWGQRVADVGKSVVGMAGEFAPAALGGGVGTAFTYANIASGGVNRGKELYETAKKNGLSDGQAKALGWAGGVIDAAQNMFLMGKFRGKGAAPIEDKFFKSFVARQLAGAAKTAGVMGGGAGMQDALQQMAENGGFDIRRTGNQMADAAIEGALFHLMNTAMHAPVNWSARRAASQKALGDRAEDLAAANREMRDTADAATAERDRVVAAERESAESAAAGEYMRGVLDDPQGRAAFYAENPGLVDAVVRMRAEGHEVPADMFSVERVGAAGHAFTDQADVNAFCDRIAEDMAATARRRAADERRENLGGDDRSVERRRMDMRAALADRDAEIAGEEYNARQDAVQSRLSEMQRRRADRIQAQVDAERAAARAADFEQAAQDHERIVAETRQEGAARRRDRIAAQPTNLESMREANDGRDSAEAERAWAENESERERVNGIRDAVENDRTSPEYEDMLRTDRDAQERQNRIERARLAQRIANNRDVREADIVAALEDHDRIVAETRQEGLARRRDRIAKKVEAEVAARDESMAAQDAEIERERADELKAMRDANRDREKADLAEAREDAELQRAEADNAAAQDRAAEEDAARYEAERSDAVSRFREENGIPGYDAWRGAKSDSKAMRWAYNDMVRRAVKTALDKGDPLARRVRAEMDRGMVQGEFDFTGSEARETPVREPVATKKETTNEEKARTPRRGEVRAEEKTVREEGPAEPRAEGPAAPVRDEADAVREEGPRPGEARDDADEGPSNGGKPSEPRGGDGRPADVGGITEAEKRAIRADGKANQIELRYKEAKSDEEKKSIISEMRGRVDEILADLRSVVKDGAKKPVGEMSKREVNERFRELLDEANRLIEGQDGSSEATRLAQDATEKYLRFAKAVYMDGRFARFERAGRDGIVPERADVYERYTDADYRAWLKDHGYSKSARNRKAFESQWRKEHREPISDSERAKNDSEAEKPAPKTSADLEMDDPVSFTVRRDDGTSERVKGRFQFVDDDGKAVVDIGGGRMRKYDMDDVRGGRKSARAEDSREEGATEPPKTADAPTGGESASGVESAASRAKAAMEWLRENNYRQYAGMTEGELRDRGLPMLERAKRTEAAEKVRDIIAYYEQARKAAPKEGGKYTGTERETAMRYSRVGGEEATDEMRRRAVERVSRFSPGLKVEMRDFTDAEKSAGADTASAAYDPRTNTVVLPKDASVADLVHEVGWHSAWQWAKKNSPELLRKMTQYAAEAPADVRAEVYRRYGEFNGEALLDEIGALRWTRGHGGDLEAALTKDANRTWLRKALDGAKEVWRRAAGKNGADLSGIKGMSAEDAISRLSRELVLGRELKADAKLQKYVEALKKRDADAMREAIREGGDANDMPESGLKEVGGYGADDSLQVEGEDGVRYSVKSMTSDVRDGVMERELVRTGVYGKKDAKAFVEKVNELVDEVVKYGTMFDLGETFDKGDRKFKNYKPNSDPLYKKSLDFSTLCKKRIVTQAIIDRLQTEAKRDFLSREEQVAVRDMLKEYQKQEKALQVACHLCYVEAARLKAPEQQRRLFSSPETMRKEFVNYFAQKSRAFKKDVDEMKRKWRVDNGYPADATKAQIKDLRELRVKNGEKDVASVDDLNAATKEFRTSAYRPTEQEEETISRFIRMGREPFLDSNKVMAMASSDPTVFDFYSTYVRNATKSKGLEPNSPYYFGDSEELSDSFIRKMNRQGTGLRHQSWSDFQLSHMLDTVSALADLSTRGAKMHAYTKVGDMVRIFGKSNIMFNLSLIPDAKGGFSNVEGMDFAEARKLRDAFPEAAGTIAVAKDNANLVSLLNNKAVDYVIPYHASGMPIDVRTMAGTGKWDNYENMQKASVNKEIAKPKDAKSWHKEPNIYSLVKKSGLEGYAAMEAAAKEYVRLCNERGMKPKFADVPELFMKGGDGRYLLRNNNYWKVLVDHKMVNNLTGKLIKQKAVRPEFDMDEARAAMKREAAEYDPSVADRAYKFVKDRFDGIGERIEDLKRNGPEDESSDDAVRYSRSDELDRDFPGWNDNPGSTQISTTVTTYGKLGAWFRSKHGEQRAKEMKILDASSGLGYGSAEMRRQGLDVDDVEPYQTADRKGGKGRPYVDKKSGNTYASDPATYDSYDKVPDGKYDLVVSNAVLNVIPDDWRANVLRDMAKKVKPGGQIYINVLPKDYVSGLKNPMTREEALAKGGKTALAEGRPIMLDPQEALARNAKGGSYQRGYSKPQMADYVHEVLGEDWKVEPSKIANGVMVTKPKSAGGDDGPRYSRGERLAPGESSLDGSDRRRETFFDKVRSAIQDNLSDVKNVQDETGGVRDVVDENGHTDFRRSTDYYNAADRENGYVEKEMRALQNRRDGIDERLVDAGVSADEFGEFLALRHAEERNRSVARERGDAFDMDYAEGAGISSADANARLARMTADSQVAEALRKAGAEFDRVTRDDLVRRHESGRISDEDFDRLSQYKHYAPLRADHSDAALGEFNASTGGMKRNEFMRAKGLGAGKLFDANGNLAVNPYEFGFIQAEQGVRGSLRNETLRVMKNLVEHAEESRNRIGRIVEGQMMPRGAGYTFDLGDGDKVLVDSGYNIAGNRRDVILFKEDGKLKAIVMDPGADGRGLKLADAVNGKDMVKWHRSMEWLPKATRWMAAMRTQYVPTFIARNMKADTAEAIGAMAGRFGLKDTASLVKDMVRAEASNLKDLRAYLKDGTLNGYVKEAVGGGLLTKGGTASHGFAEMQEEIRDHRAKIERARKGFAGLSAKDKALRIRDVLADRVSFLNELAENSTRIGMFTALRKYGIPVNEAVKFCRDATTNFNRKGWLTPYVNGAFMFSNAAIQGMTRNVQALRDVHGGQFVGAMLALGVTEAMINHYLGNDEDRENEGKGNARNLSEYEKKHQIGLPIGGGRQLIWQTRGLYATVPYLARTVTDVMLGETKPYDAALNIASEAGDLATEPLSGNGLSSKATAMQSFSPTLLDPLVQWVSGKDYKGDDRIAKSFDPNKPLSWNGKGKTGAFYKGLAQGINFVTGGNEGRKGLIDVAPEDLQLIAETVWGGLGRDVSQVLGGAETIRQAMNGESPERVLGETAFVRDWVREYPRVGSRYFRAKESVDRAATEYGTRKTFESRRELVESNPLAAPSRTKMLKKMSDSIKDYLAMARGQSKTKTGGYVDNPNASAESRKRYRDLAERMMARYVKIVDEAE